MSIEMLHSIRTENDETIEIKETDAAGNSCSIKYSKQISKDVLDLYSIDADRFFASTMRNFLASISGKNEQYTMRFAIEKKDEDFSINTDEWMPKYVFTAEFKLS